MGEVRRTVGRGEMGPLGGGGGKVEWGEGEGGVGKGGRGADNQR